MGTANRSGPKKEGGAITALGRLLARERRWRLASLPPSFSLRILASFAVPRAAQSAPTRTLSLYTPYRLSALTAKCKGRGYCWTKDGRNDVQWRPSFKGSALPFLNKLVMGSDWMYQSSLSINPRARRRFRSVRVLNGPINHPHCMSPFSSRPTFPCGLCRFNAGICWTPLGKEGAVCLDG
ncbi:hypothetical protein B0H13DRAFT_2662365 [Mycena leptocephala]|nr:hypothetical protein B0H13DRAFT_2662365 [Mycena leptocephala]